MGIDGSKDKFNGVTRRLVKIGNNPVKDAVGFFVSGGGIHIASSLEEASAFCRQRGLQEDSVRPMSELEEAFRECTWTRFISMCNGKGLVAQGQRMITFRYDDLVVTLVFK